MDASTLTVIGVISIDLIVLGGLIFYFLDAHVSDIKTEIRSQNPKYVPPPPKPNKNVIGKVRQKRKNRIISHTDQELFQKELEQKRSE